MKVLLSDITFSYLFPGGKQVHAARLYKNLKQVGVDVKFENWHDPNLSADIIHFLGFNDYYKIKTLKKKGYKLVYTHIMDGLTNQSKTRLRYHALKNKFVNYLPSRFTPIFPWKALRYFDAIVYMHSSDRKTAIELYNINPKKTFIIPHAVDSLDKFQGKVVSTNGKYLVSLGSIVPRKNAALVAKICSNNKIPIVFIGYPFDKGSNYFKNFISFTDQTIVRYLGFLPEEEKIKILKKASGFVLLSFGESGCISVYEAAATGLPLLLSDLPWAKGYEKPNNLQYCSPANYLAAEKAIVDFYQNAVRINHPSFVVHTWRDIAEMYKNIYSFLV